MGMTLIENFIAKALSNGQQDSDAHCITLFALALSLKAKNILELGMRNGNTTEPLVLASSLVGEGSCVVSVDCERTVWECPEQIRKHHFFIRDDAIHFLETVANPTPSKIYDLVYIDDWHAYSHVKRELELIDKITTPRSIIALHDLMPGSEPNYWGGPSSSEWADGGPYRAVSELSDKWEFATIPVNNGLTILRKKE